MRSSYCWHLRNAEIAAEPHSSARRAPPLTHTMYKDIHTFRCVCTHEARPDPTCPLAMIVKEMNVCVVLKNCNSFCIKMQCV